MEEIKDAKTNEARGVLKRVGAFAFAGFMFSAAGAGINGVRDDGSANKPSPSISRPGGPPPAPAVTQNRTDRDLCLERPGDDDGDPRTRDTIRRGPKLEDIRFCPPGS
jgi:hypothetical protein